MTNASINRLVLKEARQWIGTPYLHQCSVRGIGCDCLGLVRGIWRALYGGEPEKIPAYSPDWNEISKNETLLDAAHRLFKPKQDEHPASGNLIVFRWHRKAIAKHLGIVSNPGLFIHAYEKSGVVETTLTKHYQSYIAGVFQFPTLDQDE